MSSLNDILAVILGGGVGKRLYPLTRQRAKPAVPIAGKYRLIDVPISNCINSGINHIAVLTQFNSVSLHRHITQTYHLRRLPPGLGADPGRRADPPQHRLVPGHCRRRAQAAASRSRPPHAEYVLILAGDHLYRMDYDEMVAFHWENAGRYHRGRAAGGRRRSGSLRPAEAQPSRAHPGVCRKAARPRRAGPVRQPR